MADFTVTIPRRDLDAGGADMRSCLQTWEWRSTLPAKTDRYVLDFRNNEFIEPWTLSQFVAHALWVRRKLGIPIVAETSPDNPANVYAEGMGLRKVLETGTSTEDWDESSRNTGLHILRHHSDVTRFAKSVAQLGKGPNDDTMDAISYGMLELGRNVVQHANSEVGGVAIAQLFPERGAIQIAISDMGQGVHAALKANYPELASDMEAVKLAVLPHASGAPEPGPYGSSDNAGLGLFFCKEICWRAGGAFWLASQTALMGVDCDEEAGQNRLYRRINRWPGTSVVMNLPATGVEDFESLLEVCRELADKSRKSPGAEAVDFIVEVPMGEEGVRVLAIKPFEEDVGQAKTMREQLILPTLRGGGSMVLDFQDVRFATQSFIHALLNDAFKIQGSLYRLSFARCTRSTQQSIRVVAAYAASYRQCV